MLIVVRNGKIVTYDAIGYQVRAEQTPMKKDSIFRIASMSKPITTVAAMILAEEDRLDIAAPVAQYLPEFKDVKVGVEGAAPKRPMTVQDLMRHTSGLTYGLFGNSPVMPISPMRFLLGTLAACGAFVRNRRRTGTRTQ